MDREGLWWSAHGGQGARRRRTRTAMAFRSSGWNRIAKECEMEGGGGY
jgi:hypothetical protein